MANFTPMPNRFRDFSTMSYMASIYMVSPEQYTQLMETGNKDVSGLELLIQSGGINDVDDKGNFGAKRSKHFPNDFYLNNIQFKSMISGTVVGAPHNQFEINFNIIEPMGLTLLERLYAAIQEFTKSKEEPNFLTQTYVMVLRFYGYDETGKQITGADLESNSDEGAFSEKWIPFMFKNISFRLETDKVVYSCTAVPPGSQYANDQIHGTIPFNIGLQGQKVKDLLVGSQGDQPPGGAVTIGLVEALNAHQKKLASDNKYEFADEYAIEFEGGAESDIAIAKLAAKGTPIIGATGMPSGADPRTLMTQKTGEAKVNKSVTTSQVNAGVKIMTFLDLALRSSTYISRQYKQVNDGNKTNSTTPNPEWGLRDPNKPLEWFKIRPRIEFKPNQYDKKRKAHAVKITYVISKYEITTVENQEINPAVCFPVHKEYDYWFTGKNTEVLNFNQDFNFLYYTTFNSKYLSEEANIQAGEANNRLTQKAYSVSTKESVNGGNEGKVAERAANAASIIYSPADQAKIEIDILGDPDWIAQSELFYAAKEANERAPTMPDGSLNYDMSEIFFSVNFNTVVDYDRETGVADVTLENYKSPVANEGTVSQYSFVYRANLMTTELTDGKFVQRLEGSLVYVPEKCIAEAQARQNVLNKASSGNGLNDGGGGGNGIGDGVIDLGSGNDEGTGNGLIDKTKESDEKPSNKGSNINSTSTGMLSGSEAKVPGGGKPKRGKSNNRNSVRESATGTSNSRVTESTAGAVNKGIGQ